MFNMILIIFFQSLLAHAVFTGCGSDTEIQEKLTQLKVEVACAEQSIHQCQLTLKSGFVARDVHHGDPGQTCEANEVSSLPVSAASRVLATEVNAALKAHGTKYVISVEEFVEHTRLHRERVKTLGLELFKTHPELFEGLKERQVQAILEAHDKAKVSAAARGPDGRPFYRVLYEEGYGKRLDRSIVDALNAQDKKFMEEAMKRYHLANDPDLRSKMERIEKIADFVDRGMANVSPEEFGRPMEKASSFMNNEADKKLAAELEKKYSRVTSHLNYERISPFKRKAIAHQLVVEERFAEARRVSGDSLKLSARVMAHRLLVSGSRMLASFLEVLASKGVSRALMVLDFPMLYFASMDSIGCDGVAYHDWVKDPNCSPAIGLTPKIVDLLNEDWPVQKAHINGEYGTCKVITETYKESIQSPKVLKCNNENVMLELQGGNQVLVSLNSQKQISGINLMSLGNHAPGPGKAESVKIGNDGLVSEVCYLHSVRGGPQKKCYPKSDSRIAKMDDFLKTVNYQLQKGIACCQGNTSNLNCK